MTAEDDPDAATGGDDLEGVDLVDKVNHVVTERKIADLEAAYGADSVPVTEDEVELGPAEYADVYATAQGSGYSGSSVVWAVREDAPAAAPSLPDHAGDDHPRVLHVLGRGARAWALPGGGEGDEYESFQETASRRVEEQTGVRVHITGVAEVLHTRYYPDTDAEGSVHTLDVFFEAEYRGGAIDVEESELNGAAWLAAPPDALTDGARRMWDRWDHWDGE